MKMHRSASTRRDWFAFFAERGWRAAQVRYLPQESDRLGPRVQLE